MVAAGATPLVQVLKRGNEGKREGIMVREAASWHSLDVRLAFPCISGFFFPFFRLLLM